MPAILVAAFAVFCLGASNAWALQTHLHQESFAPAGGFSVAFGVGVHQADGTVYVSDIGNTTVDAFNADGTPAAHPKLTAADGVTPYPFSSPNAVAVDNTGGAKDGYVYVADPGAVDVLQFDAGGVATGQSPMDESDIPADGTAQSGGLPNVVNGGSFLPVAVSVGPGGDVYVVDAANGVIDVFDSGGTFLRQLGAGQLQGPAWLAIDPTGDLYVTSTVGLVKLDSAGSCVNACAPIDPETTGGVATDASGHVFASTTTKIVEYDSGGNQIGYFGTPTANPAFGGYSGADNYLAFGIGVSNTTGAIYVGGFFGGADIFGPQVALPTATIEPATSATPVTAALKGTVDPEGVAVTECFFEYGTTEQYGQTAPCAESSATIGTGSSPVPVHADITGLSATTQYFFRLVAGNAAGAALFPGGTFTTGAPVLLSPQPVVNLQGHSATIEALVRDYSSPLSDCHFEYVADEAFKQSGYADLSTGGSLPCDPAAGAIPADEADHPVSADLPGLVGNTGYHWRIVATNGNGTSTSEGPEFTTLKTPPIVITRAASVISPTVATLRGTINPSGLQTTYHFEYGTSTAYGLRFPVENDLVAGQGRQVSAVTQNLYGLQPGTTYHYRIVAENSAGTEAGEDQVFTTVPAGSGNQRAFELVSPAVKGGININKDEQFLAGDDGNMIAFAGQAVLRGQGTQTAPYFPRYVARRIDGNWRSWATDPPQLPTESGDYIFRLTIGISRDGTKAVVVSLRALAPGATEGDSNIYLRDVETGELTFMASSPGRQFLRAMAALPAVTLTGFAGGTPNFSHVLLWAYEVQFRPGDPPGSLYDFTNGELRRVSIGPAGEDLTGNPFGTGDHETTRVTPDGSKIFFVDVGPNGMGGGRGVYVRIDGNRTQVISASHKTGEEGVVKEAGYDGASQDGDIAYISGYELTDDSEPGVQTLYRYTVATEELERIAPIETAYQVAHDGTIYFSSPAAYDGGVVGGKNVYVFRHGQIHLVGTMSADSQIGRNEFVAWASPDGRYFGFLSGTNLTGYDSSSPACPAFIGPNNCREAYIYDADTGKLECGSCLDNGLPPTGHASFGSYEDEFKDEAIPRVATDNGQIFFDTAEKLVPQDTNGVRDVYEFDGTTTRLVSSGHGLSSVIAGVAGDGRDVFFATQNRLVKIDTDSAIDLYDARIGGGIASQNEEAPLPGCTAEDCRGLPPVPPPPPPGGSETTFGPGNVKSSRSCPKGSQKKKVKGKARCVKTNKGKGSKNGKKSKGNAGNKRRQGR